MTTEFIGEIRVSSPMLTLPDGMITLPDETARITSSATLMRNEGDPGQRG